MLASGDLSDWDVLACEALILDMLPENESFNLLYLFSVLFGEYSHVLNHSTLMTHVFRIDADHPELSTERHLGRATLPTRRGSPALED